MRVSLKLLVENLFQFYNDSYESSNSKFDQKIDSTNPDFLRLVRYRF